MVHCMRLACIRMGRVRNACKSFLAKHNIGTKKSHNKHQNLQGDVNAEGDGNEKDGVTSPKVRIPRISRTASTGVLPSSLPKSTSKRSKTPGRIRPVNSLLRSFSRKRMDSNSFNGDVNANGDGDEKDGFTSPKVTNPRISRTASTGVLPSSLPKSTSQRSKTPGRMRPVNSLLQSFSRKSMDSNSFNGAPSLSRRNSSTIVYSNANGLQKPPDMVKRLECTLEDLCFGCIKKVNIKRDVLTSDGQIIQEDEVLTIHVKPGWKKGTKVTFEGMGNENPANYAADITFVIDEKIHPIFKRNGDDLELSVELPLVDALTGCTLAIPFLDGQETCLNIDDIITPGYEKTIEGQGMTLPNEEETRGNLNIKFSVRFPQHLTEEKRTECFNILHNSC